MISLPPTNNKMSNTYIFLKYDGDNDMAWHVVTKELKYDKIWMGKLNKTNLMNKIALN